MVLTAWALPSAIRSTPRGSPKYRPPVNSRTTMRSVPSTTERRRGEASTSIGKHLAGRRFANRSSSFRSRSRPRSGRLSCGTSSHLGPPTAPKRMARLASQSRNVTSGSGSPVSSMAAPPARPCSNSKPTPEPFATTWRILNASGVTSWPIPSPGSTAILWVAISAERGLRPPSDTSPQPLLLRHVLHQPARGHDLLGELGKRLGLVALPSRQVLDLSRGRVQLQVVPLLDALGGVRLEERQPQVDRVPVEDPGEGFGDHRRHADRLDRDGGVLPRRPAAEVPESDQHVADPDLLGEFGLRVLQAVLAQLLGIRGDQVAGRNDLVGVHVVAELPRFAVQVHASVSLATSSGWVILPVTAVAAATAGLAR